MRIKKWFGYVHLWLGMATGAVVLVICLTGAIWCFSPEIEDRTQPFRHVPARDSPMLSADTLITIAERATGRASDGIHLEGPGKAAIVDLPGEDDDLTAFIDPYTGAVRKIRGEGDGFFPWILRGHKRLWIPVVGGEIVRWTTLLFLVQLISGIVLWWPKNKSAARQRFRFRWKAGTKWRRKNYDLHNIPGFYACWLLLCTVLTGIIWTFDTVSEAEYRLVSGGDAKPGFPTYISVRPDHPSPHPRTLDTAVQEVTRRYATPPRLLIALPKHDSDVYTITAIPHRNSYDWDYYYYDRFRIKSIPTDYYGLYRDAGNGERLGRMNFDIHTGNLLGLPGRVLLCLAALTGATLPVTGFLIWRGRRK